MDSFIIHVVGGHLLTVNVVLYKPKGNKRFSQLFCPNGIVIPIGQCVFQCPLEKLLAADGSQYRLTNGQYTESGRLCNTQS